MDVLAIVRPDSWNLPVFVHLVGAMVWVGTLLVAVIAFADAQRGGEPRFGFLTLLRASIPAYIVMRVGAEWAASKEHLGDSKDAWVGIGYLVSDAGVLLLVVATICAGVAAKRARGAEDGSGTGLVTTALALSSLVLVGALVAVWAMTTKPL